MPMALTKNRFAENPTNYRPEMPIDDLLRMIRLTGVLQVPSIMTEPWGLACPRQDDSVTLHLIMSGHCLAYLDDKKDPVRLNEGDALLAVPPLAYTMADSVTTEPVALTDVMLAQMDEADSPDAFLASLFTTWTRHGGDGRSAQLLTLRMYLDRRFPSAVLRNLPRLLRLPGFIGRRTPFVQDITTQIGELGRQGFMGHSIATRLAEGVLAACIKDHFDHAFSGIDVKRGLNDPLISRILHAIYEDPAQDWSIATLAERACMSRSAFISRFTRVTGQTPNGFVTSVRMMRATEMLEQTPIPLAQIAIDTGYGSEAAFSRAFHRWTGRTPGTFRRRGKDEDDSPAT